MTFVLTTLARTPAYVWFLLAWLVWQGVAGLRVRTQTLGRVMVLPAVFIASGVVPLVLEVQARPAPVLAWVLGAGVLFVAGLRWGPRLLAVDPGAGTVTRAGSAVPLVRNVVIFALQYGLAVGIAVEGTTGREAGWLPVVSRAVSGATAGYFAGWAWVAWRQYRAAQPGGGLRR